MTLIILILILALTSATKNHDELWIHIIHQTCSKFWLIYIIAFIVVLLIISVVSVNYYISFRDILEMTL